MQRTIAALAVLGVATTGVQAEDKDGNYWGVMLGGSVSVEQDITPDGFRADLSKDLGGLAGAYVGKRSGKYRFELEFAWRGHANDEIQTFLPTPFPLTGIAARDLDAGGGQHSMALTANIYRDLFTVEDWTASAGVGAGVAYLDVDDLEFGQGLIINDDSWQPAVQGTVMLSREVWDNANLDLGYRYFTSAEANWTTPFAPREVDFRFEYHELFARLSFKFGGPKKVSRPAPTPVAAPAPAPAPAPKVQAAPKPAPKPAPAPKPKPAPLPEPYIVYFDFDKANITSTAGRTIADAAKAFKTFKAVTIETAGHTDLAGPGDYNQRLSARRVAAVRAALIDRGVPADAITTASYGERDPAVDTEDNVREQCNRRVTIRLKR